MKNLLAFLCFVVSLPAIGQGVYTYPQWNPDANYSGFIESSDLLSMLTVFSQPWGFNDSASCTYDGTEFETFFGSVMGGDIIIDSISVQFILSDVTDQYFVPGCPDPLIDSVQTYFSYMLQNSGGTQAERIWAHPSLFKFSVCFEEINGTYRFAVGFDNSNILLPYSIDGLYGSLSPTAFPYSSSSLTLPFPETFVFDSTGISFLPVGASDWWREYAGSFYGCGSPDQSTCWADYITHWNMIPFWHYAE
ncbi:hypothetical protein N9H08_00460 [bacterium]|nr:hypothetical protein [bacterium]